MMFRLHVAGRREGGPFELDYWTVSKVRDGLVVHLEQFPLEQRAEAEACFDRLTAGPGLPAENSAVRFSTRWLAAMQARDEAALTGLCAPDILVEDRRPIVGSSLRGAESAVANWMAMQTIADRGTDLRSEVLATRGDRLALVQLSLVGGSALVDVLVLSEVDADERCKRRAVFSVDDEDAAFAELDARALDIEGDALSVLVSSTADYNTHDLERLGRWWHPDCVLVSHAPDGWGTLTRDECMAYCQGMFDLSPDARLRAVEVVAADARGTLTRLRISGSRDGSRLETEHWVATQIVDGLIVRLEQFAIDRFDDARECYDRWPTSLRSGPAPNAASRHAERFDAAVSSGDVEGATRLFASDSVVDDRRRLVGMRMSGESAFESARLLAGTEGLILTGESIATRGERLVLLRQQFVHRSRAVIEDLTVHQVDETGEQLELAVSFDAEDEDAAWDELDARALEIEGDVLRPLVGSVFDYNTHDLGRFREWFHADCVFLDHAPAGWGSFRTAEYLAYCQSMFEMSDDARVRALEVVAGERWGFLTRFRISGRREGGYFAQDAWIVTGIRDGRIARHEQFVIEQRADAEACFARLQRPD